MPILFVKDARLKSRLLLVLLIAALAAAVSLYATWETGQYRAGHRRAVPADSVR